MQAQGKKWTVKLCTATMCLSLFGSLPSYAGTWFSDENQKWHYLNDGSVNATGWVFDGEWYYLDESGVMLSRAWVLHEDGTWYYLGDSGAMQRSTWVEGARGKWYYVGSDGGMAVSAMTPDGYTVDDDGAWIVSIPRVEKTESATPQPSSGRRGDSGSGGSSGGNKGDGSSIGGGSQKLPEVQEQPEPIEKEEEESIVSTPSDAESNTADHDSERLDTYLENGCLLETDNQEDVNAYLDPIIYGKGQEAILIGMGFYPYSAKLNGNRYPIDDVLLSTENLVVGGKTYYVVIIQFTYPHEHRYREVVTPPSCTIDGLRQIICESCGASEEVVLPKLGHIDEDGDTVCDRCQAAMGELTAGAVITVRTELSGELSQMNFTCVDENYRGGALFVADKVIPYGVAPGYGRNGNYTDSRARSWLNDEFYNGLSVSPRIRPIKLAESTDVLSDYVFCVSEEEAALYADYVMDSWEPQTGSQAYWTRSQDEEMATYIYAITSDGHLSSRPATDRAVGLKPAFVLGGEDSGQETERIYQEGDTQERKIAGQSYVFRCIDADYADAGGNHIGALFLCDSVIGGNVCSYDDSRNQWASSKLRSWLSDNFSQCEGLAVADTTLQASYSGRTGFYGNSLSMDKFTKTPIEADNTEDTVFCLSLPEAIRYKNYLWKLDGAAQDNYVETGSYTAGYWLRTPYAFDEKLSYCVTSEGEITAIQTENESVGFRPAYVVRQLR